MCGIAGFSGHFAPELVFRMGEKLKHRGPDGHGAIWFSNSQTIADYSESLTVNLPVVDVRCPVGLAHTRLSIIDLSPDGLQPMRTRCGCCGTAADGALWLVYNGELYNYRDLRAELESMGHVFGSQSDSEVLLHLYAEVGTAMLERLNGIYAFAIFESRVNTSARRDEMELGDVFLARDGLGVKPLYYAEIGQGFLFASEIKALLSCRELDRELDLEALNHHLAYLWAPAPGTMLKNVKKLPPGNALVVREGRIVRQWCHYDLPYGSSYFTDDSQAVAAALENKLEEAVSRQMVADVPVGAFLSGGLDSSAVVSMMKRVRPDHRPVCYSIGFADDAEVDGNPADLPYARQVAEHIDVDLRTIEVGPDIIHRLEELIYVLDEPQADPAPINALLIAEQAKRDGVKVLMSGAGGDDIFSGYRRHLALRMERIWGRLPLAVRRGLATPAKYMNRGRSRWGVMRRPEIRRMAKMFAYADLAPDERLISYFFWNEEQVRTGLYTPALNEAIGAGDPAEPLRRSLEALPPGLDPLDRMLYLETKHFLADHNLNYTDKASMACGVEVRVPFLDLELVAFAARIPPGMKQVGRTGKAILKKAMKSQLPANVIHRPKTGFGAPLRRWLHNELREMVEDVLSPASLENRGLFSSRAVGQLVEQDRRGNVDGAYTIFSLVCIELWCRAFVDDQ